jgi:Lhr-like helicase
MAKRFRLNRHVSRTDEFEGLQVTVEDIAPVRKWLGDFRRAIVDPKTLIGIAVGAALRHWSSR